MVEVGDGYGALVIIMADELGEAEIEISRHDTDSNRWHTGVLRRTMVDGYVYAAVFGSLAEGDYRLWHDSLSTPTDVTIVSGKVTELDWR
jgi:predicted nucleotidyltransferase